MFSPKKSESVITNVEVPCVFPWLSMAQLAVAIVCLILQLVSTTLQVMAIIHMSVPLIFVTAGVTSTLVYRTQTSSSYFSSLAVAVTSYVAALAALAFLVAPAVGFKTTTTFGREGGANVQLQEILFVMYVFTCLSEGVLSLVLASLAYRFSLTFEPRLNYLPSSSNDYHQSMPEAANERTNFIYEGGVWPADTKYQHLNNLLSLNKVHHYETLKHHGEVKGIHSGEFSEC